MNPTKWDELHLAENPAVELLESLGYTFHREGANHTIMIRREPSVSILTIPRHSTIINRTVAKIAKHTGVSASEFMQIARS